MSPYITLIDPIASGGITTLGMYRMSLSEFHLICFPQGNFLQTFDHFKWGPPLLENSASELFCTRDRPWHGICLRQLNRNATPETRRDPTIQPGLQNVGFIASHEPLVFRVSDQFLGLQSRKLGQQPNRNGNCHSLNGVFSGPQTGIQRSFRGQWGSGPGFNGNVIAITIVNQLWSRS